MSANELLFLLSANRSGSWARFRAVAEEFGAEERAVSIGPETLPAYHRLRFGLQQLGHVEFGAVGCDGGWRVAPPVLALSEKGGITVGVACGARLPQLIAVLEEGAAEGEFERVESAEQPDAIRIVARNASRLQSFSEKTLFHLQPHASASILSCLPRVRDLTAWHCQPCDLPFGKNTTVSRFDLTKTTCRWLESSVGDATRANEGLFRFTRHQRREHYIRVGGRTFRLQGQLGNYIIAAKRRRGFLRFNRATGELTVPDICRPPLLIDRALVLCSGLLPKHDAKNRTLTYTDIPENIAGMSAGILCQEQL